MLPEPADLAMDAGALAGVNVLLWLLSLPLGKVWPVDFIWSCWPPVQCVLILARAWPAWPSDGVRRLLACTLVAVWGWRLTFNFVSRGGVGHEASAPARTGSPRGAGASAAALVSGVLAAADAVRPSLTVATALGWRTHGTAKLGSCAPGDGAEISTCTLHVFSKRGPGEA